MLITQALFQPIVRLVALCAVDTVACILPLGTLLEYQVTPPEWARLPSLLVNTVAVVTLVPHTRLLLCTAHLPLLLVKVKPDPEAAAVKVAQVPVVYHVPALMIQPTPLPPVVTWSVPFPKNGVPGGGVVPPVVLGRYLMPVAGQSPVVPSVGPHSQVTAGSDCARN